MKEKTDHNDSFVSSPLIKGVPTNNQTAINEIKKILKKTRGIHIDGLGCDFKALKQIFSFAEKCRSSIDHMDGEKIANFYSGLQRYGGMLASFGEVFLRSDLVIFVGSSEKDIDQNFLKNFKKKPDFFFISQKTIKDSEFEHYKTKKGAISVEIKLLIQEIVNDFKKNKFEVLIDKIDKSSYGSIVFTPNEEPFISQYLIELVKTLSKQNKFTLLPLLGSNNFAAAVQISLWNTGYPLRVNFTDTGPIYNPTEFSSSYQKEKKDVQLFVSCFEDRAPNDLFKKNIYIGAPNLPSRKNFDVFIPTKTPGIDENGIIFRGDGVCALKLKKMKETQYITVREIFQSLLSL